MNILDPIDKIMTSSIVCHNASTSLQTIVRDMKEKMVSTILLIDEGKISGIITERDLVHKVLAMDKKIADLKAKDIMSKAPLATIKMGAKIEDAIALLKKYHIKSLPVVIEGDDCAGIVTQTDIVHSLVER